MNKLKNLGVTAAAVLALLAGVSAAPLAAAASGASVKLLSATYVASSDSVDVFMEFSCTEKEEINLYGRVSGGGGIGDDADCNSDGSPARWQARTSAPDGVKSGDTITVTLQLRRGSDYQVLAETTTDLVLR